MVTNGGKREETKKKIGGGGLVVKIREGQWKTLSGHLMESIDRIGTRFLV